MITSIQSRFLDTNKATFKQLLPNNDCQTRTTCNLPRTSLLTLLCQFVENISERLQKASEMPHFRYLIVSKSKFEMKIRNKTWSERKSTKIFIKLARCNNLSSWCTFSMYQFICGPIIHCLILFRWLPPDFLAKWTRRGFNLSLVSQSGSE